jgi:hypothetical protein
MMLQQMPILVGMGLLLSGAIAKPSGFAAIASSQPSQTQPRLAQASPQPQIQPPELDVPYFTTPPTVIDEMLRLAQLSKNDVLYDLGSGDGRIVIAAAQKYGVRGVGIDIDPERIREANENARRAGVSDRVRFVQQDLFQADLREATVVTFYLLPSVNLKLRPKLLRELKPGTRVVSHAFDMGIWRPNQVVEVEGRAIYYWVVPKEIPKNLRNPT